MLRFLIGPTAVGKTALAIDWARANNAEILCADAPLVYKEMDIGTAKPTSVERRAVVHHGLDLVEMDKRFSVAEYLEYAEKVVKDVESRGKQLIVVGGSGFYLKGFFEPVTDGVEVPAEVVEKVGEVFVREGLEGLLKKLREVGGENLEGLDVKNPRRVIKALERCLASGKNFQTLREEFLSRPTVFDRYEKKVFMLVREKEDLVRRIRKRIDMMLDMGLIDEVKRLREKGLEQNPQTATVIGYRETVEYLDGKITVDELKTMIEKDTLMLMKKQQTFFKQLPVDEAILLGENERINWRVLS